MLMLLALALKLSDKERDVVVPLMIRGFRVRFECYCLIDEVVIDCGQWSLIVVSGH